MESLGFQKENSLLWQEQVLQPILECLSWLLKSWKISETSSLHSWGNWSPVRTSNLSVFLSGWWLRQNQYPGLLSPDQEIFLSILEVDGIPSLVWFLPPQASLPAASGWSGWRGSSRFGWELFSSTWQLFPAELSLSGNYPFLRDDLEALSLTADTGLAPKTRTLSISLETAITVTRRRLLLV